MGHGTLIKVVAALDGVTLALLFLELMIGETILGNVILLGLAFLAAGLAALIAVVSLAVKRTGGSIAACVASLALIAYVVLRVVSDSVPMGYGP